MLPFNPFKKKLKKRAQQAHDITENEAVDYGWKTKAAQKEWGIGCIKPLPVRYMRIIVRMRRTFGSPSICLNIGI
ncbi:hypothetical protein GCM10020331_092420 [Ectobacillus funiculus]